MASPGEIIIQSVTAASSLGFVPVAIHFEVFQTLVKLNKPVSPADLVEAVEKNKKITSPLNIQLAEDILFVMAGLQFLDLLDGKYLPNAVTHHFVNFPSSIQGALHFSVEGLLAGAFIYPKLVDTDFAYPFKERSAAFQYAYEKMGNQAFASEHMFSVMHEQGRMESFNAFMEGKFGLTTKMPARLRSLGYDLDSVILEKDNPITIVDIGGGQGQMLLEIKESYPQLTAENLILQEFNAAAYPRPNITAMDWDFKCDSPQPVKGATIYNFLHIFHNTPDIESIKCLKKISAVMQPHSRIFIQELPRIKGNAYMHASMIAFFGGRERSSKEWHAMAEIADLKVTFEAYPEKGEGLVEMMKT